MDQNIFIVVIILIIGLLFYCNNKNYFKNNESWINYKNLAYNNWETGNTPINYYNRPEYRKPYRWPVCINVDYPVKHCRHL